MESIKEELQKKHKLEIIMYYYLVATRGGKNRIHILKTIISHPMNINQIAKKIGLTYSGVLYHLKILEKNNLIISFGEKYGMIYALSEQIEKNINLLDEIEEKV
jgi:DNA-binding transcriptional ArsR family regulator